MNNDRLKEIRAAMADYMFASECGCCADYDAQKVAEESLAKLLRVPKYSDGSGYDFNKFRHKS